MHYCAYHWSGIYTSPVRDCGIYSRRVVFSLSFADDGVSDRSATSLVSSAPFARLVDYYYIWSHVADAGSWSFPVAQVLGFPKGLLGGFLELGWDASCCDERLQVSSLSVECSAG